MRPRLRCVTPPGAAFTRPRSTPSATAAAAGRPAARGQGPRRGAPGRLHLRAVRLPRAAHRRRFGRRRDGRVTDLEALKVEAGAAAVDRYVRSGMRLGLGSGSTAARMLDALGERLASGALQDVAGVPTSAATAARCGELGIPLLTLDDVAELDVVIDGADEIGPHLDLIKGLGGAHLREKVVASAGRRMVVVADETKLVSRLGERAPLPVEVIPFALPVAERLLRELGLGAGAPRRRRPPVRHRRGQPHPPLHARRMGRSRRARPRRLGRPRRRRTRVLPGVRVGGGRGYARRRAGAGARPPSRRSMTATASSLSSIRT